MATQLEEAGNASKVPDSGDGDRKTSPNKYSQQSGIERLKAANRIELADAEIFARNLGVIIKKIKVKTKISLRKIFLECFGEQSGESLYKKRKTIVWFAEDSEYEKHKKKFLRTPAKYVLLAEELAKYKPASQQMAGVDSESQMLAQLIERSTFSYKGNSKERLSDEAEQEVSRVFNQVAEKIRSLVDLDGMMWWLENNATYCSDWWGSVSELKGDVGARCSMLIGEKWGDTEYMLGVETNIPPCVQIGHVWQHLYHTDYFEIEIQAVKGVVPGERAQQIREAMASITKDPNLLKQDQELIPDHVLYTHDAVVNISKKKFQVPGDAIYLNTKLDLEVRYDPLLEKWGLIPIWRTDSKILDAYDNALNGASFRSIENLNEESIIVYSDSSQTWPNGYKKSPAFVAVAVRGEEDKAVYRVFATSLSTRHVDEMLYRWPVYDALGYLNIPDHQPCQPLTPIVNWSVAPPAFKILEFEERGGQGYYTPAPDGSIAHAILKNLAYAPKEQKIDHLLLKDAQEKFLIFQQYQNKLEKTYQTAIDSVIQ
jgi:hypothetical protein